jgi:glucose-1-phosphate thymidylyltransferase
MKALVLCGGRGTRLRPLTYTTAKQLIPVAAKPVVLYVMEHLREAGIRDVGVVIAPETGDQIREALDHAGLGLDLTYLVQPRPLGLADAVRVGRPFLQDSPFVMYLGDNLVGQGIGGLVEEFRATGPDALIALKSVDDPSRFGVVELEKPSDPPSDLALVGVYVFGAAVHRAVDEITPSGRGELEITDAIQRLVDSGRTVRSVRLTGWWLDTGKKDDLLEANRVVLDECVQRDVRGAVDGASRVVGRVRLAEGAVVRRSEIRGPVVVEAGTVIEDAFVGPYTSIGRGCAVRRSALEHCVLLDGARVEGVGPMEDSVVGKNAVVRRQAGNHEALRLLVGDDAEVAV